MSIVKVHNKKSGVTYVYESESYWDKEKQQPRNKRKLIGKIDPTTGEIVPTGKPGRRPKEDAPVAGKSEAGAESSNDEHSRLVAVIEEKNKEISSLKDRIRDLELKCDRYSRLVDRIRSTVDGFEV